METITRQKHPENLESPHGIFEQFLTPPELFYVRNHFDVPQADAASWCITVEGAVRQNLELSLEEVVAMPQRTVTATLECAGNSRIFLPEPSRGVQWEIGAVGTAEWSGVPLSFLLERAGVSDRATDVVLQGLDSGTIDAEPKTPGDIPFARSLPVSKAMSGDVLLAWNMNGQELTLRHGFPLRAIVPGWYGMASVKWLRRIVLTTQRFEGYFQTFEYSRWGNVAGMPSLEPLGEGEVKAEITSPNRGDEVQSGADCPIHGVAWAGEAFLAGVDISTDGGATWHPAHLRDIPRRYCWSRWEYYWKTPAEPGPRKLLARARDITGRVQPWAHDKRDRTYSIHYVLPVNVTVSTHTE